MARPALPEAAEAVRLLGQRAQPLSWAVERTVPVMSAFAGLVPTGGVPQGATVEVGGRAATSLSLALVSRASQEGSWVVAVGLTGLGLAAAAGLGVDLERLVLVDPPPPSSWATVVATLVEAFDVVLARPDRPVRLSDARRLQARARERNGLLVLSGAGPRAWPVAADVVLRAVDTQWSGIGSGHGHLQCRQVTVEAGGRRGATRPRRATLWLPGPDGAVSVAPAPTAVDRSPSTVSGHWERGFGVAAGG